jgi:hypothetical protein
MNTTPSFGQPPLQGGAFTGAPPSAAAAAEHRNAGCRYISHGTPAESILAAGQPKDITQPAFPHTPTPAVDNTTHLGGTPATGAASMVQPMVPHTPTPSVDDATHLGGTPAIGAAPMAQPMAPHTPTPTTASPAPEAAAPVAQPTPIAAPAPANVPTPPIPVRDLQGPSFLEGLMGIFGLNTQQQVDKSYKNYTDQGLNPTEAYNKSVGDIQQMRSNAQPSKGSKTHMVQSLMPDGTYQWVEEPFKKGGKVYRRTVGSQMTDHVISKFGAKLPASKYQPTGNKAGRR